MTLDGFREDASEAFVGYSDDAAPRFFEIVNTVADKLRVTVDGLDRIPSGRALLVANHAFGWDVMFPMAAIWRATGRPVWTLGEHLWWKVPVVRRLAAAVGVVDGTHANLDRLLDDDALVLVLPGGLREAVKPRELRYRLLWGNRFGFVKAAIRHGA